MKKPAGRPGRMYCINSSKRIKGLALESGHGSGEKRINSRKVYEVILTGIGDWRRERKKSVGITSFEFGQQGG